MIIAPYITWSCLLALAFGVLCGDAAAAEATSNRWNVLFIAIDDLRPELGCYGEKLAQTPHLDQLAKSAMLFRRHYVQVPTCGASRYALLTGRSPAASGVTGGNTAAYVGRAALQSATLPGAQSLPELFRRSGYRTACLGKISHTPDGRVFAYNGSGDGRPELPGAWDELKTPFGPWKRGWGSFFAYANGRHREDGKGHRDLMEFTAETDDALPDGLLADAAVESLQRLGAGDQPFFLAVGFYKPHLPFVAPRQDWEAMADAPLELGPAGEKVASPHWHRSGEFYSYHFPFAKDQPLAPDAATTARRAYYACVRYVDRQVGKVLDALDALDLAKDTVVVVWGDHGWHLGEQQIWGKHSPFERANRSVLMIRTPRMERGVATETLVETIDIYPTLVDLCQPAFQETAWPLSGESLVPLLHDQRPKARQSAISYWGSAVSLRTDRFRLIVDRKHADRVELYDLMRDPESQRNIASDVPETVKELRAQLDAALKAAKPK